MKQIVQIGRYNPFTWSILCTSQTLTTEHSTPSCLPLCGRESCLHVACFEGNVAAARYLLSLDADPNSANIASGLNTPLHEAIRGGSLAIICLLLKSSANVLAANAHGDLPLHVACRAGRLDIARRLLAYDADWTTVTAVNHAGLQPLDVVRRCTALGSLLQVLYVLLRCVLHTVQSTEG